jgi:CBS domain-containing protein
MKVENAMTTSVATCLAGDALRDAALLMDRENRGSLFVLAEDGSGRIQGVLTDRDVCLATAREEERASKLPVRAVMSGNPHVCHPQDYLEHVLQIIETTGRRRLPVVDDAGHILGAISLTDIARVATEPSDSTASTAVSTDEVCRVLVACARERREPEHLLLG